MAKSLITKEQRKIANRALAAEMRLQGFTPSGEQWTAAKNGTLAGFTPSTAAAPVAACPVAPVALVAVAPVDEAPALFDAVSVGAEITADGTARPVSAPVSAPVAAGLTVDADLTPVRVVVTRGEGFGCTDDGVTLLAYTYTLENADGRDLGHFTIQPYWNGGNPANPAPHAKSAGLNGLTISGARKIDALVNPRSIGSWHSSEPTVTVGILGVKIKDREAWIRSVGRSLTADEVTAWTARGGVYAEIAAERFMESLGATL